MHRNISLLIFSILTFSLFSEAQEKKYYSELDPKIRLQLLGHMRVRRDFPLSDANAVSLKEDDKNNQVQQLDYLKYLSEKCGVDYTRDQNGLPIRPKLTCVYSPRVKGEEFNGFTSKFECLFNIRDENGEVKEKSLKVKYDPHKHAGGGYKEIPQAIMGTALARLFGFYSPTYCPADITCKNCPSEHPWSMARSTAPAVEGNEILFENVIFEIKQKGFRVTDSKNQNTEKPQGFNFRSEMNRYFPNTSEEKMAFLRTERDALTLWVNFVGSHDADNHNNKLYCLTSIRSEKPNDPPRCVFSIGLFNDYGNGMGYKDENTKLSLSRFSRPALFNSSNGQAITSGASGNSGAAGHAMSLAGRDLFVSLADSVSDKQLEDIFNLAQVEKVSNGNVEAWKKAFRTKIQRIKDVDFDSDSR